MSEAREPWALVLGASSGFGEATALALAADGYHVAGVHLDRRASLAEAELTEAVAAINEDNPVTPDGRFVA